MAAGLTEGFGNAVLGVVETGLTDARADTRLTSPASRVGYASGRKSACGSALLCPAGADERAAMGATGSGRKMVAGSASGPGAMGCMLTWAQVALAWGRSCAT